MENAAYSNETGWAFKLVATQIAMVAFLASIAVSPWYSKPFCLTVQEHELLDHDADVATGQGGQYPSALSLHFQESRALMQLKAPDFSTAKRFWNPDKLIVSKDFALAPIAYEKVIRTKLTGARRLLDSRNEREAKELALSAVSDLLYKKTALPYAHRSAFLTIALDLLTQMNTTVADIPVPSALSSPPVLRDLYRRNDLPEFERDVSGEYEVRFLMGKALTHGSDAEALIFKALKSCTRSDVFSSTKTSVLFAAAGYGQAYKNERVTRACLESWKIMHHTLPDTKESAALAAMMLGPAFESKSPPLYEQTFLKMLMASRNDSQMQSMIDNCLLHLSKLGAWPPKDDFAARHLDTLLNQVLGISKKRKLSDVSIRSARLTCAVAMRNEEETLLRTQDLVAPAVMARMRRWDEGVSADALLSAASFLQTRSDASKTAQTSQSRVLHVENVLVMALDLHNWHGEAKAKLLSKLSELANLTGHAKVGKRAENELESLAKDGFVNDPHVVFHAIVSSALAGKIMESGKIYSRLQSSGTCDPNTLAQIEEWMLGHLRSYPNFSASNLQAAKEGRFPNGVFQSLPARILQREGAASAEYGRTLLYLAEYEFCRGNEAAAIKLCQKLLSAAGPKGNAFTLAARVLTQDSRLLSMEAITAPPGSNYELECLRAIFLQLNLPEKAEQVKRLQSVVKESS